MSRNLFNIFIWGYRMEICKCLRYIVCIFVVHFFKSKYWYKLFRIFFRCQISWRGIFRYWNFPRGTTGRNFENSCSALSPSTLIFEPCTTTHRSSKILNFAILNAPQCSSILNSTTTEFSNLPISQFPTSQKAISHSRQIFQTVL